MSTKKILIAYTDAGGGHKATAEAIKAVIETDTPHQAILMNPYKELITDVDLFARLSPYTDEDVYNKFVLGKGWNNLFCLVYFGATLLNVKLGTRESARRFAACWKRLGIDLVISVMPMSNQGLYQSVKAIFPKGPSVPFLVVMTDMAETMKYTWFPKERDYYALCPGQEALDRLLQKPHPRNKAFSGKGLVVHPKFYSTGAPDVPKERGHLGLLPDRLTGCVMYGGGGSKRMAAIAKALPALDRPMQMIFLCGQNQALADTIQGMNLPFPHVIRTFTRKVPYYFAISDFLVGKPGPGTISEALVSGIRPLVDVKHVLPQERYNVKWLKEQGLGTPFWHIPELISIIRGLAGPDGIPLAPHGQILIENRAVFNIPNIIEQIFWECSRGTS